MGEPLPFRVARVLALRRRKLPCFQIARAAKLAKATVSRLLRRHRQRLAQLSPPPPIQRSDRLPLFLHNYNWHRPHHSLEFRSPISRHRLPLNNLLSLHT